MSTPAPSHSWNLPWGPSQPSTRAAQDLIWSVCLPLQSSWVRLGHRTTNILSKEPCPLVGHGDPVLAFNVQFILSCSKLLFKFVDVCNLHPVHQGQPLRTKRRVGRERVNSQHSALALYMTSGPKGTRGRGLPCLTSSSVIK